MGSVFDSSTAPESARLSQTGRSGRWREQPRDAFVTSGGPSGKERRIAACRSPRRREAPMALRSWLGAPGKSRAFCQRPTKSGSARPKRREAPSAQRSWQKSRLLPARDGVGLRPASAGPNKSGPLIVVPDAGQLSVAQIELAFQAPPGLILQGSGPIFLVDQVALGRKQLQLKLVTLG